MMENERRGKRGLGAWMSTALVVGNMIGSGVFLLPAALAVYGSISLFGWFFTTGGAILLALVFSRLSRLMPAVGGPYAYTRRGFGDFAGFLVGWGYWISIWCANAAIAVALVSYLSVFFPALATTPSLAAAAALASIWLLTGVNIMGVRWAGRLQLITTIIKLLPLLAVATLGLLFLNPDHFTSFHSSGGSGFSALTAAAALTLFAFLGLESATIPANDVENAGKTIPRATIAGTLITAAVYILGTAAVMGIVPRESLIHSAAPFADAASSIWGPWAQYAVAAGAAISCFGALNGWILLQGQVPLAMARDRLFPGAFGRLSGRGTPVTGLVVSSVLVSLLLLMNYTRALVEQFKFIILLATMTCLVPYIFSSLAELMILARGKGSGAASKPRLKKSLGLGIPAFLYSLWTIGGSGQETVYWGFLLLMAGIPVYVWFKSSMDQGAEGSGNDG
jgi:APA family basic amino acid/polyamine antiporter